MPSKIHFCIEGLYPVDLERYMKAAIGEAEESLREGNKGFGAVIVRDGEIIAAAHDLEETDSDPTSHAEVNAIRAAGKKLGKKLSECVLVSTHEPCPMCAFAIVWSGIGEVAFGYSISDALAQGRRRIDFPCTAAFRTAGADIAVHAGVLKQECSILYHAAVRKEIENLRNADDAALQALNEDSVARRTSWFRENSAAFQPAPGDLPNSAYRLLLRRFGASAEEMPVVQRSDTSVTFHSANFCPTLEACKILRLDTRHICRRLNESSTDTLLKQLDPRLRFTRNYKNLRPYSDYCEETISLDDGEQ